MTDGALRIGQVAERTGLDVRLIRHYEKIGLIPPPGRGEAGYASAGYRLFTEEHVQRLEFIALARLLDLPLREIGDLLSSIDDGCCTSAQPHARGLLAEKLQEVDGRIAMLQELRHRLQRYQHLTEVAKGQRTAGCAPGTGPIQCAFGETSLKVNQGKSALEVVDPLTFQWLESPQSKMSDPDPKGI